jgi:transposase-like protein
MAPEKITKRYSLAVRQAALEGIAKGLYTKSETARLYGVSTTAVSKWIRSSRRTELLNKIVRIQMPDEPDKIKKLEDEKKKLESALAQAQLKIITLESTIQVLEEQSGKGRKKKPGTK